MAGLVANALGRNSEQQEEMQEPADNPQEEMAETGASAGKSASGSWNGDKVLQTATQLAFETLYSEGGFQALEERLSGAQDLPADMADIVANAMRASMAKAQANGRTIPGDTLEKLAKTLTCEVLRVAGVMKLVDTVEFDKDGEPVLRDTPETRSLLSAVYRAAMQAFAQQQQGMQPQSGATGAQQQMAGGAQ